MFPEEVRWDHVHLAVAEHATKLLPHCMILAILFDYLPESLSFIHVQSLTVF